MKAKNINTKHPDLELMKPLQPCDAYFGWRVNAANLYHECEELEAIRYTDVTSMFLFVLLDTKYQYPIQDPVVLVKGCGMLMPIVEVFGVMKILIEAPNGTCTER